MAVTSKKLLPAIASQSLGRAWHHSLEKKLSLAAAHGMKAIELFMEDLEYVANEMSRNDTPCPGTSFPNSTRQQEQKLVAATYIGQLCMGYGLTVLCLQPFMHYDGLLDTLEHEARLQELRFWIVLAQRVGTDLIQIPSSFLPQSECSGDRERIVADLQAVADIGLHHDPVVRFAYEALCWGTHVDTWDQAWDIVRQVDRPNFGTCLDTFNIAGRVFADPSSASGLNENAYRDMATSMKKLREAIDITKVFYVEVCDGERLEKPLTEDHEWYVEGQKPRMTWSRNARLFPFEDRGYLPVLQIFDAILEAGYEGFVSFELFSRTANAADSSVPEAHAQRANLSWQRLMQYCAQHHASTRNDFGLIRHAWIDDSKVASTGDTVYQQGGTRL